MGQRIRYVRQLLAQGLKKGEIKRRLKARYKSGSGNPISARTCEDYLRRARAER